MDYTTEILTIEDFNNLLKFKKNEELIRSASNTSVSFNRWEAIEVRSDPDLKKIELDDNTAVYIDFNANNYCATCINFEDGSKLYCGNIFNLESNILFFKNDNGNITDHNIFNDKNANGKCDYKIFISKNIICTLAENNTVIKFKYEKNAISISWAVNYSARNINMNAYIFPLGLSIIKQDGVFYSINDENYDLENKSYNSLTKNTTDDTEFYSNNSFKIKDLCNEKTINGETFKPIDKFEKFKILKLVPTIYNK